MSGNTHTLAPIAGSSSTVVSEVHPTDKKKEIYTYEAPWPLYAMGWNKRPGGKFCIAVGSYKEEYNNQIHIIQQIRDDRGNAQFSKLCEFEHPYPATKIMWAPAKITNTTSKDLIATTGDYLRLWSVDEDNKTEMKQVLNNNKHSGII